MRASVIGVVSAVGLVIALTSCRWPTQSSFTEQRKVPFFKVLAYENVDLGIGIGVVTIILFEDEAGNCFITSGYDGGISLAPLTSCQKARTPNLEAK